MLRLRSTLCAALPQRTRNLSLEEWLNGPSPGAFPDSATLTPEDISRIISISSAKYSMVIPPEFLDSCVDVLARSLAKHHPDSRDICSSIHVLDRFSANVVLHESIKDIVDSLTRNQADLKLNKTDAFLGARAGLLLGFPDLAAALVTRAHIKSFSMRNLIQLGTLSMSSNERTLQAFLHQELVSRLDKSEELQLASSHDLVSALRVISNVGVTARIALAQTTRTMKKAGSELVRRIELRTISSHSIIDLLESFSGQPPCPIHPLLLQACYAYLLEDCNYECLSREEIARAIHASTLAEIENTVLTSVLVQQWIQSSTDQFVDVRTSLRMLSGISLSRAPIPSTCLRAISCHSDFFRLKDESDKAVLSTAFANLVGSGALCSRSIHMFLSREVDTSKLGLLEASNYLLICCSLPPNEPQNGKCQVPVGFTDFRVPQEALEITEKSNPALPRSDVKKKRLAKRIEERALSPFQLQVSETKDCEECGDIEFTTGNAGVVRRLISRCQSLLSRGPDPSLEWKEVVRSVADILTALHFLDLSYIEKLSLSDLCVMDQLVDECLTVIGEAEEPRLAFEEHIHDVESSVVRTARNLGVGYISTPLITNSNHRVTLELS